MGKKSLIIIVTYNSNKHINWVIEGLDSSTSDVVIKIIDSGSTDTSYLHNIKTKHHLHIEEYENIGFVAANNKALTSISDFDWVLFLNPDARIEGKDLDRLLTIASQDKFEQTGIFSIPLIRYDIDNKRSLGIYDSLGISCNTIGRWFDLGSNQPVLSDNTNKNDFSEVEAVCGAFMLVRKTTLEQCPDRSGNIGFESNYYMYKEDIELSLRVRKKKWGVTLINDISAFHCRGWNSSRSKTPYWARYHSAINDVDVAWRYKTRALAYAVAKYIWVKFIERK
ncbi:MULTISPECIES: glycosyltransferase family 2 protein [Brenneria]|uniref:Glycosyltransferase family 2 protein n=1 Tax=Brenneria nigrifluens DSM 30175 = ATCC 13028 TaxID=1121120 RepID=A0A2U1UX60_9GAMM|nr:MULTISPECIES: glycosyltransferase [Brenneria]EHD22414.1 glycosyl transferase family 2 [Brenneria sp. EniD312]PWC26202.1 glycosyltransferase family 2 protein [Brenneria nigrifluens DSM 30175 = ATCC 13028]QCR05416.1 glycosyltransferase family 2 protein [Brenneria nigrifluens DSM 30175 = ATCC 13028]